EGGRMLGALLIWYWITRATTEGARWLDAFLGTDAGPAARPFAWAYFARGFLAVLQADIDAAVPALERGVAIARSAGQLDALSQLLAMSSIAADMGGDQASSRRLLDQATAAAQEVGELGTWLMLHHGRAPNGLIDDDLDTVRMAATEGIRLSREAGDVYSLDMMLMNQGFADLLGGNLPESEGHFREALGIARQLDDRVAQCYLLGALG